MNFKLEWKKIFICFAAVTGMGFFLSFLILCNLGTDPCTFMNRSIAARLGMTFGNLQLIVNISILIVVFLIKKSLIGFGTLFNMILIGYYADFFCWLWKKTIPDQAFTTPIADPHSSERTHARRTAQSGPQRARKGRLNSDEPARNAPRRRSPQGILGVSGFLPRPVQAGR